MLQRNWFNALGAFDATFGLAKGQGISKAGNKTFTGYSRSPGNHLCVCVRHAALPKVFAKPTTHTHARTHTSLRRQATHMYIVVTGAKNKTGALSAFTPATPHCGSSKLLLYSPSRSQTITFCYIVRIYFYGVKVNCEFHAREKNHFKRRGRPKFISQHKTIMYDQWKSLFPCWI